MVPVASCSFHLSRSPSRGFCRLSAAAMVRSPLPEVGPLRGGRVTAVTGVPRSLTPSTWARPAAASGRPPTPATPGSTSPTADSRRLDGRGRSLALRPERRLRRHRLVQDPQQCLHRPRHLQIHRRGQDLDVRRACATSARSRPFASTRPIPTSSMSPRSAIRSCDNKERGVYRSSDGGKTWKQVLFISRPAPARPISNSSPATRNVLFACMWHGQRKPWTIISGAREGGIYKSTDGGDPWTKLGGGLPNELFGRSNVAISRRDAESHLRADRGQTGSAAFTAPKTPARHWTLVNGGPKLITRPFYYTTLGVDPEQCGPRLHRQRRLVQERPTAARPSRVARAARRPSRYLDQPEELAYHDPVQRRRRERLARWRPHLEHAGEPADRRDLPGGGGQSVPYRVYGAQQDNTTVIVPSLPLGNGQDFRIGPGCETGPIIPNSATRTSSTAACKGQFSRLESEHRRTRSATGSARSRSTAMPASDLIYRFQRVSPMEVSPHDPNMVYYGSQFVHRTRDGGVTWEAISPDLTAHPAGHARRSGEPITRDATGEEVYSTLYSIRESPLQKGVIWTGSNDGLVLCHARRRQDAGPTSRRKACRPAAACRTSSRVRTRRAPPMPPIYRFLLGDFAPYIYRTDDFGKTWTRSPTARTASPPTSRRAWSARIPIAPGCSMPAPNSACTFRSITARTGSRFQLNLPDTPVTDIKIAHEDLVLSTQGRALLDSRQSERASPASCFKRWRALQADFISQPRRSGSMPARTRVPIRLPARTYPARGAD